LPWPGGDWSLLALFAGYTVAAVITVPYLPAAGPTRRGTDEDYLMRMILGVTRELSGLFVDDKRLALSVVGCRSVPGAVHRARADPDENSLRQVSHCTKRLCREFRADGVALGVVPRPQQEPGEA
jgi:hypothetical protein